VKIVGAVSDSPAGTTDADENVQRLRLTVQDDGPGLPEGFDPEHSSGLGMRVVTSLVQQLEGTLHAHNGSGAHFDIDVKMKMGEPS
jgi:two-component sensor histidine kinase